MFVIELSSSHSQAFTSIHVGYFSFQLINYRGVDLGTDPTGRGEDIVSEVPFEAVASTSNNDSMVTTLEKKWFFSFH